MDTQHVYTCAGPADQSEPWQEEQTVLAAIYDDALACLSPSCCTITLQPDTAEDVSPSRRFVAAAPVVSLSCTQGYPSQPLLVAVAWQGAPAGLLRALTARAAAVAASMAGEVQGYAVVEAVAEHVSQIRMAAASSGQLPELVLEDPYASTHVPVEAVVEPSSPQVAQPRPRTGPRPPSVVAEDSQRLAADAQRFASSAEGQRWARARLALPAGRMRKDVLAMVQSRRVTVVCGATGCGKSTQVPQFLLEQAVENGQGGACNIIVTQPRRISATGLASRVAAERGERVGGVVGYSVRLESKASAQTRLLYCTTGMHT